MLTDETPWQESPPPDPEGTDTHHRSAATDGKGTDPSAAAAVELERETRAKIAAAAPPAAVWRRWRNVYRTAVVPLLLAGGLRFTWELLQTDRSLSSDTIIETTVMAATGIALTTLAAGLFSPRDWHRMLSAGAAAGLGVVLTLVLLAQGVMDIVLPHTAFWYGPTNWSEVAGCGIEALAAAVAAFAAARLCRMEARRILDLTAPTQTLTPDEWGARPPPIPAARRRKMLHAIVTHRMLAMIPAVLIAVVLTINTYSSWQYGFFSWARIIGPAFAGLGLLMLFWGLFTRYHAWRFTAGGLCLILNLGVTVLVIAATAHALALLSDSRWGLSRHLVKLGLCVFLSIAAAGCLYGAVRLAWLETLLLPTRFKAPKQIEEEEAAWAANWDQAKPDEPPRSG
ncbi:MAG: hypothetical protein ACREJ2_12090 [Planctomycetota bacterium]